MKDPADIISELLKNYETSREFARAIGEDPSDIVRWRNGTIKIKPRAVIGICRLHPNIKPHDLNSSIFPKDLRFSFGEY